MSDTETRRARRRGAKAADGKASPVTTRQMLPWVLGTAVVFAALMALDRLVLHPAVLTDYADVPPQSPLYAFLLPEWRASALLFVLLAAVAALVLPRLVSFRVPDRWFAAALLVLSAALPLTLFLVRENLPRLGAQFLIYPHEEYFDDAARVLDLREFLRHYTELAPQLSLHGRVHPPGFATFLYVIGHAFSPTPLAAGIAVLLVFCAGTLAAWRAFALVLDRRVARTAAVMLLAAPSLLDFACTSMDAVFYGIACLALYAALLALAERGCWWHAALTGVALYAASFCSFSAVLLGLFVGLYAMVLWWQTPSRRIAVRLSIALAGFATAYAVVRFAVGFDLWESFQVARAQHYQIMAAVIGRTVAAAYVPITVGNLAAFLIGTGLGIVPLFARRAKAVAMSPRPHPIFVATVATLLVSCCGGLYTMETERILMFAVPWVVVSATSAALSLSDGALVLLTAVGWAQALLMEVFLFTLW